MRKNIYYWVMLTLSYLYLCSYIYFVTIMTIFTNVHFSTAVLVISLDICFMVSMTDKNIAYINDPPTENPLVPSSSCNRATRSGN